MQLEGLRNPILVGARAGFADSVLPISALARYPAIPEFRRRELWHELMLCDLPMIQKLQRSQLQSKFPLLLLSASLLKVPPSFPPSSFSLFSCS